MSIETIPAHNFTVETAHVKAKKVNLTTPKVNIKVPKDPSRPVLSPENGGLTDGHRATINTLVNELVELRALKEPNKTQGQLRSRVWSGVNKQAQSLGKDGAPTIQRFPDCDFERAELYLKKQITIAQKNEAVLKGSPDSINALIKGIQARCNELGIDREKRKAYQLEKFGRASLADMNVKELKAMYTYVFSSSNPVFDIAKIRDPIKTASTQASREAVLNIVVREILAKNAGLTAMNLVYSKDKIRQELEAKSPALFPADMAESTFKGFWTKQKVCKLKRGVK